MRLARNGGATSFQFIQGVAGVDLGSPSMKNTLLCIVLHFPEISAFLPPGNH